MTTPYAYELANGMVVNVITGCDTTVVSPQGVIPFNVVDAKGRAVGMWRRIEHHKVKLATEKPARDSGYLIRDASAPTSYFEGTACSTRNEATFGSAMIVVRGATLAEVEVELDKRIYRARAAAVKKFGK